MEQIALSTIIGAPVYDSSGELAGHVREVAISPQVDPNHISDFIVKSRDGDRLVSLKSVLPMQDRVVRTKDKFLEWPHLVSSEGLLLLERDLLGDLPRETSDEILEEMEPEERQEVAELLAFQENTAAGRMTNEYLALPPEATVNDAINRLREFEGATDTISTIFLVESDEKLVGSVPLVALVLSTPDTKLSTLSPEHVIFCEADVSESEVAEMFDKYNLQSLPVVNDKMHLTGIITADDVISILRSKI